MDNAKWHRSDKDIAQPKDKWESRIDKGDPYKWDKKLMMMTMTT